MTAAAPIDVVLGRLEGVQRNGRHHRALCPAHPDRNPSLGIDEGDDGRVLLQCYAGCDFDAILTAAGLAAADLFPPRTDSGGPGVEVARYHYTDATGGRLFDVVRYLPKTFRQWPPDQSHGKIPADVPRVVYRYHEVARAVAGGDDVWVVEGEKDADRLAALGHVATCNPMGAGKWRNMHAAELQGAGTVSIVADRDEAGRQHAKQIARTLAGLVDDVIIYEPVAGKDLSDHLDAGHELEELDPVWVTGGDARLDDLWAEQTDAVAPIEEIEHRSRFATGGRWILDAPKLIPAVWGRSDQILWAQGEPFLIVGPSGVGKSTLAHQLVAGRLGLLDDDLLGLPVAEGRRKVLYLASDRPQQIRRAMRRLFTEDDRQVLEDRLIVWQGPPPEDLGLHPERLPLMCAEVGADTVILDSLKDMAVGISGDEVGAGLNRGIQAAIADGVEVVCLHHQRKGQGGTKPKTLEDVFGSTWVTAGSGSVVLLWGKAGDPIVELAHLKQPANEVGPLKVEHDHHAGRTTVNRGLDVVVAIRNAGTNGLTVTDIARLMFEKTAKDLTENETKKARRRLDAHVRTGELEVLEAVLGGAGGSQPARFVFANRPSSATPEELLAHA